jgi:hypothetical protein
MKAKTEKLKQNDKWGSGCPGEVLIEGAINTYLN